MAAKLLWILIQSAVNKVFLKKVKRPIVFFWIIIRRFDTYVGFVCFDSVNADRYDLSPVYLAS